MSDQRETSSAKTLGFWGQVLPIAAACAWPYVQFLNQNAREVLNWPSLLAAFAVSLAAFLVLLLVLKALFRSTAGVRPVCLAIVACVVFFNYNAVSILMRDVLAFPQDELGFVKERSILMVWAAVLVVALLLTWVLAKTRTAWLFLTTIVGIGLALAGVNLALAWISSGGGDDRPQAVADADGGTLALRPNIYFVVLDAYSRRDALRQVAGFDNDPFVQAMAERGFYEAARSYANYPKTFLSIGSTLDMDYLVEPEDGNVGSKTKYSLYMSGKNRFVETLKQHDYRFVLAPRGSASCVGYEDVCVRGDRSFGLFTMGETEINLLQMTPMLAVIRKFVPDLVNYEDIFPEVVKDAVLQSIYGSEKARARPSFLFYHNLAAHGSQYAAGCDVASLYATPLQSTHQLEGIPAYVQTIECLNEKMLDLVDTIQERDPGAILVIQSDHGVKFGDWGTFESWTPQDLENRFGVLNLVRLPEQCRDWLYPTISPVNTFRVVLSCLKGDAPTLLEDRSYWMGTEEDGSVVLWKAHEK